MKKYRDRDGDIWFGPNDSALFLRGANGEVHGIGVSKSHIERHCGELVPLEED
jgi:hypothetical protein